MQTVQPHPLDKYSSLLELMDEFVARREALEAHGLPDRSSTDEYFHAYDELNRAVDRQARIIATSLAGAMRVDRG